jgi:hypothetical protein
LELLYFILCCYGLTQVLVYGSIFDWARPSKRFYNGFFHCPMCVGFHVGWFVLFLFQWSSFVLVEARLIDYFLLSCLSSGTSYSLNQIFGDCGFSVQISKIQESVEIEVDEDEEMQFEFGENE